ncbi:MAG: zinc ribbon domain-containing protein [Planctomycetota bacterium]
MPVYEYRCDDCEHLTEALRRMSDADEAIACEACGSARTRRVHSVFAAQSGSSAEVGGCGQGACGMPPGTAPGMPPGLGCCGGGACGLG